MYKFIIITALVICGCSPTHINENQQNQRKTRAQRPEATSIEGNLVEISYLNHVAQGEGQILLQFEDGREIVFISTRENSWTYPLKRGYVKIDHNYGRVIEVFEKNEEGEWIEVR
tara:strand:- start:4792 stop:5136 length:345 start_codon:yes stop_codon:yes gene_type:complete